MGRDPTWLLASDVLGGGMLVGATEVGRGVALLQTQYLYF